MEEQVINTFCSSHCGGCCLLKVHVKDGVITRIETDDSPDLQLRPQLRACLKGRAYRQRIYDPNRLLYPLKRTGKRGESNFTRISWDEALDTITGQIKRIKEAYGSPAIIFKASAGDLGFFQGKSTGNRLFCLAGGYSEVWGTFSYEGCAFACVATYGSLFTFNSKEDLLNSKMIIIWGWDPANSIQDTNTTWLLLQAREKGARIISVDPRYTDTTAAVAQRWIPIKPTTDGAMLAAMAYVIVKEGLADQRFLDTYTVGFDKFEDYILGKEDGIAKTPQWAEPITGVLAKDIYDLAVEYGNSKPAALVAGIAPGRTAYGEQFHRLAMALTAMTGNIGIHGGSAAGRSWCGNVDRYDFRQPPKGLGGIPNEVEDSRPPRKDQIAGHKFGFNPLVKGKINITELADAILLGEAGGFPNDYKMLYLVNTNPITQYLNVNKLIRAFHKLEFIVVHEQLMTATAKFADIILPTNTMLERYDMTLGGRPFYALMKKVVEPLGETKSHFQIFSELAERLGVQYTDITEEEWMERLASECKIPDFDKFRDSAIYEIQLEEPHVAFRKQIEDPVNNPFPTPSGKIEIYSQLLADMNNPYLPPIPKYIPAWEGPEDELTKKYPLQLVTTHLLRRAHSQWETVPWLRELQSQKVLMNSQDAVERGIKDGDLVKVFNERGVTVIRTKVSERIMPGVVDIPQGAWYNPDEKGVDQGGCCNVLTRDKRSPGGAFSTNSNLVQIEKV